MKKLFLTLSLALIVLGLDSCKPKTPNPTRLMLSPTEMTLQIGDSKQLNATVEPVNKSLTVTFASDKPEIASVDAKGLVKAISEGTAEIIASVGTLKETCIITVIRERGTTPPTNELPLLKFNERIKDSEVVAHEEAIGRTLQNINVGMQRLTGYANKDLTIAGAIYGLQTKSHNIILALSQEELYNMPATTKMLEEYGFTKFLHKAHQDGSQYKYSESDTHPEISVIIRKEPNHTLGTKITLEFRKTLTIDKMHDIIPTAEDFPSYQMLKTKDPSRIKSFEEDLDLRDCNTTASKEDRANMVFMTKNNRANETNFTFVYYVSTPERGPSFINCIINCISSSQDFSDPRIKEWLAHNGYPKDFKVDKENNIASAFDETGTVKCQIFIKGAAAFLQIFESSKTQSNQDFLRSV